MYLSCGTKFLRVLIFAIFPAIRKNKFPQIKTIANIFSAKIYNTKTSCLFNYNVRLSLRNKTVYNELLV